MVKYILVSCTCSVPALQCLILMVWNPCKNFMRVKFFMTHLINRAKISHDVPRGAHEGENSHDTPRG